MRPRVCVKGFPVAYTMLHNSFDKFSIQNSFFINWRNWAHLTTEAYFELACESILSVIWFNVQVVHVGGLGIELTNLNVLSEFFF